MGDDIYLKKQLQKESYEEVGEVVNFRLTTSEFHTSTSEFHTSSLTYCAAIFGQYTSLNTCVLGQG